MFCVTVAYLKDITKVFVCLLLLLLLIFSPVLNYNTSQLGVGSSSLFCYYYDYDFFSQRRQMIFHNWTGVSWHCIAWDDNWNGANNGGQHWVTTSGDAVFQYVRKIIMETTVAWRVIQKVPNTHPVIPTKVPWFRQVSYLSTVFRIWFHTQHWHSRQL